MADPGMAGSFPSSPQGPGVREAWPRWAGFRVHTRPITSLLGSLQTIAVTLCSGGLARDQPRCQHLSMLVASLTCGHPLPWFQHPLLLRTC